MGGQSFIRPLPLRERVGRGVITLPRTRRLVEPCPPLPGPLPQGEREPEIASTQRVTTVSTVLVLIAPSTYRTSKSHPARTRIRQAGRRCGCRRGRREGGGRRW